MDGSERQIEIVARIREGAYAATDTDEVAFADAVDRFLDHHELARALALVLAKAHERGLVERGGDGRVTSWPRVIEGAPASGAGDLARYADEADRKLSPSPEAIRAMGRRKAQIHSEVFGWQLVSGRRIGELRYSELLHVEQMSARDARILSRVRKHSVPAKDQPIADYFPADKLAKIIREESDVRH